MEKKWETEVRETTVSIRDGNKFFTSGLKGEMQQTATITISGDTFVLEGIRAKISEGIIGDDTDPGITDYITETYKRMN